MFLLELRPTASKALTCIRPILDTAMKEDRLRRQNEQIGCSGKLTAKSIRINRCLRDLYKELANL